MSIDIFILIGIVVAGLITFAVVMGRWEKAAKAAMAAAGHFQAKGLEAKIDRARNEVHISVEGHDRVFRAPLGHLVVEHKVETVMLAHEKRPRKRCRIHLTSKRRRLLATGHYVSSHRWAETIWTTVETGKTWVRLLAVRLPAYYARPWADGQEGRTDVLTDCMDVTLPNGNAKAFKLWLDHHGRELLPDVEAVRARWDQACAELLRACRQQRDHHGDASGAFETWVFSAQPTIAYLVIEADGAAFWASGDTPMLVLVDRPRFTSTREKLVVSSGGDNRSFPIPTERLEHLRALTRRGAIRIV
jgi:hypothetical protein